MKKLTMFAGASLLVIASSAFAEQSLNDTQMDVVSAGGATALGTAGGIFWGDLLSSTISNSSATVLPTVFAVAHGDNTTIATSLLGVAAAGSGSTASAGLW